MATIYKEFAVDAPPEFVWAAVKDVGAVHTRLAKGFVTNTVLTGGMRTVTFANGLTVTEQIVGVDDEHKRLAYFPRRASLAPKLQVFIAAAKEAMATRVSGHGAETR